MKAYSIAAQAIEYWSVSFAVGLGFFVLTWWLPEQAPALSRWLNNPPNLASEVFQTFYDWLALAGIGLGVLYVFVPRLRLWLFPLCVVPLLLMIAVIPLLQYASSGLRVFAAIPERFAYVRLIGDGDPLDFLFTAVELGVCLLDFYVVGVGVVFFLLSMFTGEWRLLAALVLGVPISILLTPVYVRWVELVPESAFPLSGVFWMVVAAVVTAVVILAEHTAAKARSKSA